MIKLLIIDDETTTRKGLIKHIAWNKFGVDQVKDAKDGIDGLETAKSFQPDIIIADIRMPGMNGIEMASCIKEELPDCRLIFLSGYSDKEYLKSAIRLSAVSYVEKPINLDELSEAIKMAVALCVEEREKKLTEKRMLTAFSESTPLLRQKLVANLICREVDRSEVEKGLNLVGVAFGGKDTFTVMIIRPELPAGRAETDRLAIANEVLRLADQCLGDTRHICVLNEKGNIIAVLACVSSGGPAMQTLFQTLNTCVREQAPQCSGLFCAVGQNVPGMERIWESYQTALQAFQKLYFTGYGNMVCYENQSVSPAFPDESAPNRFRELLQQQDKEQSIQFLETFCEEIKSNCQYDVDGVRNVFFKMAYIMDQQAEKRGIEFIQAKENKETYIWAQISGFETLQQTKEYFIDKMLSLFAGFKGVEASSRAITDVMKYIQKNYSSVTLSNNTLAEHVYLTPTYLSALFKKQTGKTISEYLTEYRIEKSKDMLRDPRIKLYEIARRVGYSDANYYAKAFKKQTGLTPSEYREKYRP